MHARGGLWLFIGFNQPGNLKVSFILALPTDGNARFPFRAALYDNECDASRVAKGVAVKHASRGVQPCDDNGGV